jgi:hypothetical protein
MKEQHAGRLDAGALLRVRHIAWQEGAGAGATEGDLIANLGGDLAGEDAGDLVALVVSVEISNCFIMLGVSPFCSFSVNDRPEQYVV